MLAHGSHKAKRISHSTSHAESLSSYNYLGASEQVAARFTELNCPFKLPSLDTLISLERYDLPIATFTDCHDFFDLVSGAKGVPQDRSQRLIILSLREKRFNSIVKASVWCTTHDMVSNALTKYAPSEQLAALLEAGKIVFKQFGSIRLSKINSSYTEEDLAK